jgi:hypothetical protein
LTYPKIIIAINEVGDQKLFYILVLRQFVEKVFVLSNVKGMLVRFDLAIVLVVIITI